MTELTGAARQPMPMPAAGSPDAHLREHVASRVDETIQAALAGAREFLGMDVAFVGEFTGDRRVLRYVAGAEDDCPVQVGATSPLEETYCQRVVDGRLPAVIPDVSAVPEAAALAATRALSVGSHLGVPITLPDGRLYGTLCAFSTQPVPALNDQQLGALQMLSNLLSASLGAASSAREELAAAEAEVLALITQGGLTTVLQPIVELRTGRRVGFEALTRFREGTPDEWFGRAATTGLSVPLELAALDAAVRHVAAIPADEYLAVNLSATVLCSEEFAKRLPSLPLERLVVELTEQTEVTDHADLAEVIGVLRERGARVAVDDAGSGYAGLQRILALAPDVLKLDRELIRGIDHDPARRSLTLAMCQFARHTGATLIAEGIESPAELGTLVSLGVGHGQGYHLGRPATPGTFGFADRSTPPGPPSPRRPPAVP